MWVKFLHLGIFFSWNFLATQNHRISSEKNPVALPQPSKGLKAKDGGIEAKDRWGRRNTQRLKGGGKHGMMDGWCALGIFFLWPFNFFFEGYFERIS